MPRVTFVKKARKDNPVCARGESYYWWKFRYGGKRYSLRRPRPSQLTQSAFYGAMRSLTEMIDDSDELGSAEDFTELRDTVRDELETIQSDCQESLDNMPEQLQYAPTGELLQERIDAIDSAMSDVEGVEPDDMEDGPEDKPELSDFQADAGDDDDETVVEKFNDALEEWNIEVEDFEELKITYIETLQDLKSDLTSAVSDAEV
jgi:hypothetical protein